MINGDDDDKEEGGENEDDEGDNYLAQFLQLNLLFLVPLPDHSTLICILILNSIFGRLFIGKMHLKMENAF